MTNFPTLLAALDDYLAAVEKRPGKDGDIPDLRTAMAQLEQTAQAALPQTPPQLRHYLAQRSYRKAYNFLLEQDHLNQAGHCGRHQHDRLG